MMRSIDSLEKDKAYPLTYKVTGDYAESGVAELGGMRLRFEGVTAKDKTINIGLFEKQLEFIVVKVLYFPWIIIVWVGSIIMFLGLTIGVWRRAVKARQAVD